jgi:predicted TIM-barrel fold metal-dependent hydrolase
VSLPEHPGAHGLASFHDAGWTPFWAACEELGVVVCLHVGSGASANTSVDASPLVQLTLQSLRTIDVAADLVWSGLFVRHPRLRFCLPSHGADWLGSFLRRVDATYVRHRSWGGIDYGDHHPSSVFRHRVLTCFIEDEIPPGTNVAGIAFSSDYPHADSPWPRSPEVVMAATGRLSEAERIAVTHGNAVRHFGLSSPQEDATVGRLRDRRIAT